MSARGAAKPPYRIPSMAEIAAAPKNGLRVASTFTGAGGSTLGFRMAGYETVYALEFVEAARDVYRANHPTPIIDSRDVREVTAEDFLEKTGLAVGELDVLEGSPPCASFSTAGRRSEGWGMIREYSETSQRVDDLFFEYARLLEGIQPRAFVAENVSGLVKGSAKGYFKEILARLRAAGYRVEAKLLDAQWLGVPQSRQRLIFMGIREDQGRDPAFPSPLPYRYSVRDALPWVTGYKYDTSGLFSNNKASVDTPAATVTISGGGAVYHHKIHGPVPSVEKLEHANGYSGHAYYDTDRPAMTVQATRPIKAVDNVLRAPTEEELAEVDVERFAIGPEAKRLRRGATSKKYISLVRVDPERPSFTVTAAGGTLGAAGVVIVEQGKPRKFTIAELRRICGFPDDFILTGTYKQQWERLGRAVPPPMMYAVARELAGVLA